MQISGKNGIVPPWLQHFWRGEGLPYCWFHGILIKPTHQLSMRSLSSTVVRHISSIYDDLEASQNTRKLGALFSSSCIHTSRNSR